MTNSRKTPSYPTRKTSQKVRKYVLSLLMQNTSLDVIIIGSLRTVAILGIHENIEIQYIFVVIPKRLRCTSVAIATYIRSDCDAHP